MHWFSESISTAGIRVAKIDDPDGAADETTYLIDAYNHTGYAQTFVESDGSYTTSYIIGDDVLAQADGTTATSIDYLLYDGHGSTRQLTDSDGVLVPNESYSYDGYSVMLGGTPEKAEQMRK